jgi:methyl-accepting chemotaxis protein
MTEEIAQLTETALGCAKWFENSAELAAALAENDRDAAVAIGLSAMQAIGLEYFVVTDTAGNVLARSHEPEKYGDSIANQVNIQKALAGEASVGIEEGTVVKMSIRAGSPIRDANGSIVGAVSTGYVLGTESFVRNIKQIIDADVVVYNGQEQVMSTFTVDGAAYLGAALNDASYDTLYNQMTVLTRIETIRGARYITVLTPILSVKGTVLGVIGVSGNLALASTLNTKIISMQMLLVFVGFALIIIILMLNTRRITRPLCKVVGRLQSLANGDLTSQAELLKGRDEIAVLAHSLNDTILKLNAYISDITGVLTSLAENDYTSISQANYMGDFLLIQGSLNKISSSLNATVSDINESVERFDSSATQVASASRMLADGADEQATALRNLIYSIDTITGAVGAGGEGGQTSAEDNMARVTKVLAAMDEMRKTSGEIGRIVKTIDDIAFQTNILSMNAAIEAARAGAAGKGFSVVAEEFHSLAIKVKDAATQTTSMVDESVRSIEKASELAKDVVLAFNKTSTEQAEAIAQIGGELSRIDQVIQSNSSAAEQSAAASVELSDRASMLKNQTAKFRLMER